MLSAQEVRRQEVGGLHRHGRLAAAQCRLSLAGRCHMQACMKALVQGNPQLTCQLRLGCAVS